jgi:hypothetical protein
MTESKTFGYEREELMKILSDRQLKLEDSVVEIINTFQEMITLFVKPVQELDMGNNALREYMAEKAEDYYDRFRAEEGNDLLKIEKNPVFIFDWSSISLIKDSVTLLYPYMLLAAANYHNFIPLLCRKLRKLQQVGLNEFFNVFYNLSQRLKPKLTKWDVDFIKNLVKICQNKENYPKIVVKYRSKKRYKRLNYLRVLGFYYAVNFSAIGLVPYMHLAHHKTEIPENLKPFLEFESHPSTKKQRGFQVFRQFLLPVEMEEEWSRKLTDLGITAKLLEGYYSYNLDSLIQTSIGTWKWDIDLLKAIKNPNQGRYDFIIKTVLDLKVTPKFIDYLESIHQMGTAGIEDIRITTGISPHITKRFQKKALDEKFILPDLFLSQIGLNSCLQLCINPKNQELFIDLLEKLPKVKIMKSKELHRYLIYLPIPVRKRLEKLLPEEGIISKEVISLSTKSIKLGVNLPRAWELKEEIREQRTGK